jgi:hypothetical protein
MKTPINQLQVSTVRVHIDLNAAPWWQSGSGRGANVMDAAQIDQLETEICESGAHITKIYQRALGEDTDARLAEVEREALALAMVARAARLARQGS